MTKKKVFQVTIKDEGGKIIENKIFTTKKKAKDYKKEMIEYSGSSRGISIKMVNLN